jgi:hypothetical protein
MSRFLVAFLGASIFILGSWSTASAESAPLQLIVEPGAARHELELSLENQSDGPLLVYLDSLLAQVELRGERHRLGRCRAPADATPRSPDRRRFVELEPGERASEALDLRFICWGRGAARLDAARAVRVTYRVRFATDRLGRRAWTGRLGPVEAALELEEPAAGDDGHGDIQADDGGDPAAREE